MRSRHLFSSLTRISDLREVEFEVSALARSDWEDGDYVVAEAIGAPSRYYRLELHNGRMVEVMEGIRIVGALGTRSATLEAVGSWREVGPSKKLDALTAAGLLGRATSVAPTLSRLMELRYLGHAARGGRKIRMRDFVPAISQAAPGLPVILLVGTSMSAGKTTTGRAAIHILKQAGLTVVGAKLTGAGRYRDILGFKDAGADRIVDFVDAGLPSTVVSEADFRKALQVMFGLIAQADADILVVEAGASPLEPYNGAAAVAALRESLTCTILCASDPYAVLGVQTAFRIEPDLVTGPATNTQAGIDLVSSLTGVRAINILNSSAMPELATVLKSCLPSALARRL